MWPLSRQKRPKQFQTFVGQESLLQHMVNLTNKVLPLDKIYILATQEFSEVIKEQIPNLPEENLLFEPMRRDNGPAALLGMIQIKKRDPDAIVAILWSDHLITEEANFSQMLEASFASAEYFPNYLVTVGANPSEPDTGLGYIQMEKEIGRFHKLPVYAVKRFVEKPDLIQARRFVNSWEYLWNTGYKIMGAAQFVKAFRRVQPKLRPLIDKLEKTNDYNLIQEIYADFHKQSIEYLFTPYIKDILVVPADIGWSDVGNWNTLHDILKVSNEQNLVKRGRVVSINCQNTLVFAKDRVIATLGLENLIIVDDGDCLLVMNKENAQDIKLVINHLEEHNEELL